MQGSHALDQYGSMMNDFLAVHATAEHAHEGGQVYDAPNCKAPSTAASDAAAVAIAKASPHDHCFWQAPNQPWVDLCLPLNPCAAPFGKLSAQLSGAGSSHRRHLQGSCREDHVIGGSASGLAVLT